MVKGCGQHVIVAMINCLWLEMDKGGISEEADTVRHMRELSVSYVSDVSLKLPEVIYQILYNL